MGSVSAETIYEPGSVALRGGRRESRRDVKRRPETRAVVGEFDANAVQVGDGLDEREAQTVAFAGAGRVQPDEAAEHAVALRVRDPGTGVRYGTPEPKAVAAQRHGDAGSRPGVADRVLDQVRQHLGEEVAVAAHAEPRDDLDHHGLAGIFRHRPVGFGDGREHGRQVDVRETAAARPGFDLGDPEQRREDAQDSIHVAARGLDGGLVSLGGPRALPRRFEPLPQVGERRAEVVGDIVRHLSQAFHEQLDAIQHLVGVRRQPVELVARAPRRHPPPEVAFHYGSDDVVHGLDTPQRTEAGNDAPQGSPASA